ncbi:hypothetical protein I2494_20450 [Budviciaceae bacterium BWR-B9]|uniref:Uncharacterized protein n=1 Tax=Limnobaculum allomyrinae TaxID=2791986 RepID=A0ABS1IW97_9GAMM|nr:MULTISPECIES: hypothetical protein [Limnobaculum]MBK5146039.1 hypothetical protein [Limnobaculum allomyrinae]MBV7694085.1 hypothetical protein [Limnobaculum sp. M2-1]
MKKLLFTSVTGLIFITTSSYSFANHPSPNVNEQPAITKPFTQQQVCKAAISTIFGKPTNIIKVKNSSDDIYHLSYVRPDDKKLWKFKCKLSGNNIIWTEEGYESDRWLGKGTVDSLVNFTINGKTLEITEIYSDNSTNKELFQLNKL